LLVDSEIVHGQRIEGKLIEVLDLVVVQVDLLDGDLLLIGIG
jgi:hypothetical protein